MSDLVLGIDLGSTRIKVIAFDGQGRAVHSSGAPLPVSHPAPDRAEVDMDATWDVVRSLLRETVDALPEDTIVGIGVTAAGAGLWATTAAGTPVAPAVLWNDGRSADLMLDWMRSGLTARLAESSANVVMPGYPLPMLAWTAQNDPEGFAAIERVHFAKDWIGYCLTGVWVTDPSDASLGLIDQDSLDWSPAIFAQVGLELVDVLPPILPATDVRGTILTTVSDELGLPATCVVSVGLMDVAATALGAGAAEPGDACTTLGTSAINGIMASTPHLPPAGVGQVVAMPDGLWLKTLVNTSGTQSIEWVTHLLDDGSLGLRADHVERLAASSVDGAHGILFHPYLSLAGSIAPFVHPGARGNLFGLTANTSRADIARAVFEGVALAIAECYSAMSTEVRSLRLAGGGARSTLWRQLIADLLDAEVVCSRTEELGARGAAMTASVAAGIHASLADVRADWVEDVTTVAPDPTRVTVLASNRAVFRDLTAAFAGPWTAMLEGRAS